jgi:hypothetical protein
MTRSTRTSIAIATGVIVAVLAMAVGLLVAQRRSGSRGDHCEAVKSGDADFVRAHREAGADQNADGRWVIGIASTVIPLAIVNITGFASSRIGIGGAHDAPDTDS